MSQLRLPLPCHSPVSKRRWHDADTLELERFADGPTRSGRIADPARSAWPLAACQRTGGASDGPRAG